MPTKTPSTKAKKPATKAGAAKPAAAKAEAKGEPKGELEAKDETKKKRGPKATAKPGAARDEEDGDGDGDEDDDDEEEFLPKKAAGSKPAAEPTAVVPARRLTPEAKAAINAMVQKGVPLDEALRRAASWETFVAPVKDDSQKAFPGKEGGGPRSPFGGRRPSGPRGGDKNELPNGGFNFEDEDPRPSLSDDEPIVAGGDDD